MKLNEEHATRCPRILETVRTWCTKDPKGVLVCTGRLALKALRSSFISPFWYCFEFQSLFVYSRKQKSPGSTTWTLELSKETPVSASKRPVYHASFPGTDGDFHRTRLSRRTPTQIHPLMAPSKRNTTTHRGTDARRTSRTQHARCA